MKTVKKPLVSGIACRMEQQTPAEKKMTLAQKRIHFRCKQCGLSCSNCPMFKPPKK